MTRKNEFMSNIDTAIGVRIGNQRRFMGLSRQQLAGKIYATHQQLQKYEQGVNRITAGRLYAIAVALKKPVAWFFESFEKIEEPSTHKRLCIETSRSFMKIKSPEERESVNNLIKVLSASEAK